MEDTTKILGRIAEQLDPLQLLEFLVDGARFAKKAEKFEEGLHKELDKMVKDGELTEHEARWKFHADFTEFTDNSVNESVKRILKDDEEDDDDSADEVDTEEETGEETNVDMGDPSGDRSLIDIHIHCHHDDCK